MVRVGEESGRVHRGPPGAMSTLRLSRAEVYEGVRALLIADFGVRGEQVAPSARLVEDLDLDSVDWIDMAVALEVQMGQELDEEDLGAIRTVEDVVDVIFRRLQAS